MGIMGLPLPLLAEALFGCPIPHSRFPISHTMCLLFRWLISPGGIGFPFVVYFH